MKLTELSARARLRLQKVWSDLLCRRLVVLPALAPYVSFSFDDFPRSALHGGGEILMKHGARGTYYTSFGLMGKNLPSGPMFLDEDIETLLSQGHELGCHTYDHCHSWDTRPAAFERSIRDNLAALKRVAPDKVFRSFSYPFCHPRPGSKGRAGKHFLCCRNGGQATNQGVTDLNLLKSFFLEKSGDNLDHVKRLIDRNLETRGWLIFSTHDVGKHPTSYGCGTEFFEQVVRYSVASGSRVLPVADALQAMGDTSSP